MKVVVTRGLPGSGKSWFAKELIDSDKSYVRVNRDEIRLTLYNGKFSAKNEELTTAVRDSMIDAALLSGRNVVVDETALSPSVMATLKLKAEAHGAEFEIKEFNKPYEDCIRDDLTRANPVGHKVITRMYLKYIKPKEKKLYEQTEGLPSAILVDIDGTVANCDSRSPFDTNACLQDRPNNHVISAVVSLSRDHRVFFITGRDERFREKTTTWIKRHVFPGDYWFKLHMRADADKRKDYEVKEEIIVNEIIGRYNVLVCFEDRPRNLRMMRRLGLSTMDCGLGFEF